MRRYIALLLSLILAAAMPQSFAFASENTQINTPESENSLEDTLAVSENEGGTATTVSDDSSAEKASVKKNEAETAESLSESAITQEEPVSEDSIPEDKPVTLSDNKAVLTETEDSDTISENEILYTSEAGLYKYYEYGDGTAYIEGMAEGVSVINDPVIPSTVDGLTVVGISYDAFKDCTGLTGTLTIPGSIKTIPYNAFND